MKKVYISLQQLLVVFISARAQNLYSINNTWLNLETFGKSDTAASAETDFKKGKYACRFGMPCNLTDAPQTATYQDRTFRIIDGGHVGIKNAANPRELVIPCNVGENEYDEVPGNNFLLATNDGVVLVQRFEEKTGYRITKYDEYGKVRMKQTFPHTRTVTRAGVEYKQPYLVYLMHTDRYIVFTSLASHDIHKTIVVDLKDGKVVPIESTICGAIRTADDKGISGYLIRDDKTKTISISTAAGKWALRENNLAKVMSETILNDTMLVMAKYYKAAPGISLAAFNVKTGKLIWIADVKKPAAAQNAMYLSMYKNKVLMEGNDTKGNYLQAFDITTGKRTYSTF